MAYYLRSLALAREEMIVLLRGQLVLEGQDKVMLLQLIDDAATRECEQMIGGEMRCSHIDVMLTVCQMTKYR